MLYVGVWKIVLIANNCLSVEKNGVMVVYLDYETVTCSVACFGTSIS